MTRNEPLPPIFVSTTDRDRLESLVDTYRGVRDDALVERLASELSRAEVLQPEALPSNVVRMHSKVRVRDLDSDELRSFELVYPHEADARAGRVSVVAPAGCAVLGLVEGERIAWPLPGGRRWRIEVVAVGPSRER